MLDRYRFILGAIVVVGIMALAASIALGHVEEKSSYGLDKFSTIISIVAYEFAKWAYQRRNDKDDDEPKSPKL